MTDRELMQQALYALEYASDMTKPENMSGCGCPICVTITVLRDRLAQPEQEPVASMSIGVIVKSEIPQFYTGPLYLTPSQRPWVGLTDEELEAAFYHVEYDTTFSYQLQPAEWCKAFAQHIESQLRSKNT